MNEGTATRSGFLLCCTAVVSTRVTRFCSTIVYSSRLPRPSGSQSWLAQSSICTRPLSALPSVLALRALWLHVPFQALVTPGGLARLLIRSCQALSAADLALTRDGQASEAAAGGTAVESGGGTGGGAAGSSGVSFLSGGAEGEMTAAIRTLHELGPSAAGRYGVLSRVLVVW